MNKTAAFLLGSGVSLKSGAKNITDITTSLLTDSWEMDAHRRFSLSKSKRSTGVAHRTQAFLERLHRCVHPNDGNCNYEDLYAYAHQLYEHSTGRRPNPLLKGICDDIRAATSEIHRGENPFPEPDAFTTLLRDSIELIQWAVHAALAPPQLPVGFEGLGWVARQVNRLDIFTLNHDVLTENYLHQQDIAFTDGFNVHRPKFRRWNPDWDNGMYHTRLLKLHGSVNWYLGGFRNGKGEEMRQYIAVDPALPVQSLPSQIPNLVSSEPHFLSGTLVKEQRYHTDLIGDLFIKFRELLSQHRQLICCGYGWGDHGINARIEQWLADCRDNRLIILHGDQTTLHREVHEKPFWLKHHELLTKAERVRIISCWLPGLGKWAPLPQDVFTVHK